MHRGERWQVTGVADRVSSDRSWKRTGSGNCRRRTLAKNALRVEDKQIIPHDHIITTINGSSRGHFSEYTKVCETASDHLNPYLDVSARRLETGFSMQHWKATVQKCTIRVSNCLKSTLEHLENLFRKLQ